MAVEFIDNRVECKNMIRNTCVVWLYEACGELEAQVKRNSKRVTGGTAGSFSYRVDETALAGYVGSGMENAVWEEFGTGEYALDGNGRKGGWWIKVGGGRNQIPPTVAKRYGWIKTRRDKNGNLAYVFTKGKKPKRPLLKAFTFLKSRLVRRAEELFGGM